VSAIATDASVIVDVPSMRRRVWALAWPVIGENFLQTMLGIVDMILVASLGAAALAGVGSAQQIMFFVIAALSALSVGSSVLVAQAVGAQTWADANHFAQQSLLWSVIIGVPFAVAGVFLSDEIIAVFGMEPDVARIGTEYLQVTMGTAVVLTAFTIGSGVLRGANDSRTPMLVTALANVINIGLTYFGKFGFPALGAVGSAWATFLARLLALTLLVIVLWRGRNGVTIRGFTGWRPNLGIARRLLGVGVPAAVEQLMISAGFLVQTIVVAQLGTPTLAAHRILFNALALSFLPGVGFGLAATSLVGQYVGSRQWAQSRAAGLIATQWAILWMGTMGMLLAVFARFVVGLYSEDPTVLAIGINGMRVLAPTQPVWAIILVQSGALRGTGNTRFPLWVNTVGVWCAVVIGALLTYALDGGLVMIWSAFLLTGIGAALALWRRFQYTVAHDMAPAAL